MTGLVGYDTAVRNTIPASLVILCLLVVSVLLVPPSYAQINGTPASVTSPGFGGRAINGPPASVTSLGPSGYTPGPPVYFSTSVPPYHPNHNRGRNGRNGHDGHRHGYGYGNGYGYGYGAMYAVPVPYAVDDSAAPEDDDADASDNDPNYQGGPTIFDRRGSGARSYVPPVQNVAPPPAANRPDDASSAPDPTLLVFKDGHKLEVGNYAIVGSTLFDLTPGHARKIALADLDIPATSKQNDDRGVVFQLPPSVRAN